MRTAATAFFCFLATTLSAQAPDDRADASRMFLPSGYQGPSGPWLDVTLPPVLGGPLSISIQADPSAAFGITYFGTGATTGLPILIVDPLLVYVDPLSLFADWALPLSGGLGTLTLPIPPSPPFLGLDLALQAVVLAPNHLGATNLVGANLGSHAGPGHAAFGWSFAAHLEANSYFANGGVPMPIYCNQANNPCQVTIRGTRNTTGGRLEIRNSPSAGVAGGPTVIATVPTIQGQFAITVTVAPGQCLYLFNRDDNNGSGLQTGPIDVQYTVESQCP